MSIFSFIEKQNKKKHIFLFDESALLRTTFYMVEYGWEILLSSIKLLYKRWDYFNRGNLFYIFKKDENYLWSNLVSEFLFGFVGESSTVGQDVTHRTVMFPVQIPLMCLMSFGTKPCYEGHRELIMRLRSD